MKDNTALYILISFLLFPMTFFGQDTSFVQKHLFDAPVRNVINADGAIYVKTGEGLFELKSDKWKLISNDFKKRYLFYDKSFYESDFIPDEFTFNPEQMSAIIPQSDLANPTLARIDDQLFVSVGGKLFEYVINEHFTHTYRKSSIRDIYHDDSIKIISSYSGIYINDSIRIDDPYYSNGHLTKIQNQYLLCVDGLYRLDPKSNKFINTTGKSTDNLGSFRKLVNYEGAVYAQLNNSIAKLDSSQGWAPILQEHEFLDITNSNDLLYFGTAKGILFESNGIKAKELANVGSPINDVYAHHNMIYLGTDKGLYRYHTSNNSLENLLELPFIVGAMFDLNDNLWIASENGLFVCEKGSKVPIPYIQEVEFNRGAMELHNGALYVGSTSGLFTIDYNAAIKDFIPSQTQVKRLSNSSKFYWLLITPILVIAGYAIFKYRKGIKQTEEENQQGNQFSLETAKQLIIEYNIISVEEMAEYLETNTVQLNRMFKAFDTTPGKYLKQVKMEIAAEMLSNNTPVHEVVKKVGYSANFIKKTLKSEFK